MSQILIQRYLNDLSTLRRVSGTSRESVVSEAFKTLLKDWGKSRDLFFVPQYEYQTLQKKLVYPDGALVHELRVPFGYWEAKDEEDDLDEEIEKKFRRGYPQDNILFEDSREAVLVQNKREVMRCGVEDVADLQRLLELFFDYEREEIAEFREAIEKFKGDLPQVLGALRDMIEGAHKANAAFRAGSARFLKHAQETINPNVTAADVREMLIQHVLTEEIFSQVFDNADFHRRNNVAKELYALEETFFTGGLKHKTLAALRSYYAAIKSAAALVTGHHEKQKFLKVIYENFYKVYDRKKADRLGVVYTPNEIVRFMIESADWLCQKHFGKSLIDKNVEILDPAVGTGTFITELIDHFRGQPAKLRYKFLEELHANEVAILPYYVANLNIEATYAALTDEYEEFPNLCFVDTLDNTAALRTYKGQQGDLFGALSEENVARIKRQNKKKISVVIGNPPYNANQLNENENNKNREYPEIDRRIKETYISASTAQKTKLYDMYARFFRWATDRVDENGIVAFVSNRSFIESRTFDGFRKMVADEFNHVYVIDLGGDVRTDPRLSGTKHNVFGIQTGVAISFMVKRKSTKGCRILYSRRPQLETAEEKLEFLGSANLGSLAFENAQPNAHYDWINQTENDFDSLIPIADKGTKSVKVVGQERAVFKLYSLGASTNRDEWLLDHDHKTLCRKVQFLVNHYQSKLGRSGVDQIIKWSETLLRRCKGRQYEPFDTKRVTQTLYRPYAELEYYSSDVYVDRPGLASELFSATHPNVGICFMAGNRQDFAVIAAQSIPNLNMFSADATQYLTRLRVGEDEKVEDNITDWALAQFRSEYEKGATPKKPVTRDAIFGYVYGILHDPIYRKKYALNLKRQFPRIPFYADFWQWVEWGEALIKLHVGYKTVQPWPLKRIDTPDEKSRKAGLPPKGLLKADKESGNIQLDSETQLTGVPPEAWTYKLGNRSALEWILDQYKEKTPKDPTISERFNTYRFADHKEKVIGLLERVTRVSVETMRIVEEMRAAKR